MKLTDKTNISLLIKRVLRKSLGARNNCPVKIIEGSSIPKLKGYSSHYTNKSGDIIRYPIAHKKAYGKPIYHSSSLRIEVGAEWLLTSLSLYNLRLIKLKAFI